MLCASSARAAFQAAAMQDVWANSLATAASTGCKEEEPVVGSGRISGPLMLFATVAGAGARGVLMA